MNILYLVFLYLKLIFHLRNHILPFPLHILFSAPFSQYKLIKEYNISTGQLDRLRKNGNVSTYTLNQLCKILECKLEDIAIYTDDEE